MRKVILGKDTIADKKYLEVPDEAIAMVEYRTMTVMEKLVVDKQKAEALVVELTNRIEEEDAKSIGV